MIGIIDYGSGNIFSIRSALDKLGFKHVLVSEPNSIFAADKLILPGVGSFGDAMTELEKRGLAEAIKQYVRSKYLLGICVGMQVLFSEGTEFGLFRGLNVLPGKVVRLGAKHESSNHNIFREKIPHIGWGPINVIKHADQANPILKGIKNNEQFYFAHSFHAIVADKRDELLTTLYGTPITAAVARENIFGTQFHPEKSGKIGLSFLNNFCSL